VWTVPGKPPLRNCPALQPPLRPALEEARERIGISSRDAGHYAAALARWTLAGFPVRDAAQIERIEREQCGPCDKNIENRCAECGCRVNKSRMALANKIAMATENCPLGKW
jgi:hypothetical protein